jgi:TIR domain
MHEPEPMRLFYSYSHKDEKHLDKLRTHLSLLRREGLIDEWHDRKIGAGQNLDTEIDKNLALSRIILLLVSADFLQSDYCYSTEMTRALEMHEAGKARVIPVILRPVDWKSAPFAKLKALPKDGKAVTTWRNQDAAWTTVAERIRAAILELNSSARPAAHASLPREAVASVHSVARSATKRRLAQYIETNQDIAARILKASPETYDPSLRFDTQLRREVEQEAPLAFPDLYVQVLGVGSALDEGNRLIDGVVDSIINKQYPLARSMNYTESWQFATYDRYKRLVDAVNTEIMPRLASLHAALSQLDTGGEQQSRGHQEDQWVIFNQPDLVPTGASFQGLRGKPYQLATEGEHTIDLHNEGNSTPSDVHAVVFPSASYLVPSSLPPIRVHGLGGVHWEGRVDVSPSPGGRCLVRVLSKRSPLRGELHLIGGHPLFAPPQPDKGETAVQTSFAFARLTLTYRDRIGRRLASAFDIDAETITWHRVAGPVEVERDLQELADQVVPTNASPPS